MGTQSNLKLPIVSVRIMAYQNAPYIRQCIDSVLMQQTDFPFEICIGEDGSTDGTREICLEYQQKYPDIVRVFLWDRSLPEHKALPTARYNFINTIKKCRGKYIALLDGDDYWTEKYKLQKQVDILENNLDISVCHHWHRYSLIQNTNFVEVEAPINNQGYLRRPISSACDLFSNNLRIKVRTMLIRNYFINTDFPPFFYRARYGDLALAFILGIHGNFFFIDECMAVYRQLDNSILNIRKIKYKNTWNIEYYKSVLYIWDESIKLYKNKCINEYIDSTNLFMHHILKDNFSSVNELFKLLFFNYKRNIAFARKIKSYKLILIYIFNYYKKRLKYIIWHY